MSESKHNELELEESCGEFCPLVCECGERASMNQHKTAVLVKMLGLDESAPEFVCDKCADALGDKLLQEMARYVAIGRTLRAALERASQRRDAASSNTAASSSTDDTRNETIH